MLPSANVTSVPRTTTPTTFLGIWKNRRGFMVYNGTGGSLYLKLGSGVSTTSYTILIGSNTPWVCPFSYSGVVSGVWSGAGSGAALVTEVYS